ncbi:MAG: FAD-binding oxidoreductase [Gemmatimonadales bacterium]
MTADPSTRVVLPPPLNGISRTDPRARAAYSEGAGIYRVVPAAVVVPSTTGALRSLVAWASRHAIPLVPRGAGSGMTGGNVGDGIVVDLTVLDGCPLRVNVEARRARTGAGLTHGALQVKAQEHGLRLPPDPSSSRFATLGGLVSTNASGARSVAHGSVRPWIEALDVITADGDALPLRRGVEPPPTAAVDRFRRTAEPAIRRQAALIRDTFPRSRKNSAGYALDAWLASGDLLDLFIGAEGTLGIVTEIEWSLAPVPAHRAGVRAALRDLDSLGAVVSALLMLEPSALEYLDATFLRFALPAIERAGERIPAGAEGGILLLELEGEDEESLLTRLRTAESLLRPAAVEVASALEARDVDALWDIRHAASPILAGLGNSRRSMQVIEDGCVPVPALARYVAAIRTASNRHDVPAVLFGHAGDGHVHVNLLPDTTRPGWEGRLAALYQEATDAVLSLGGTPTGEHGDGRLRTPLLARLYGEEVTALFRLVKEAFDPRGILNPGVKVPLEEDGAPFAGLKVGPNAAALPADIERGLREIERNARYSIDRLELADGFFGLPRET